MYTRRFRLAGFAVLVALSAVLSGCGGGSSSSGDSDTFVIGGTEPLSGDGATTGQDVTQASELAAKEINADGGVLGKQIKFDWEDSQLDPQVGVTTAEKLAGDGVQYIVTGGSAVVQAQVPVADREHVILLNPLAQAPALDGASSWLFNMLPTSNGELEAMAQLAVQDKGLKTIGILRVDTDLGTGNEQALEQIVPGLGGQIVADESYPAGATDMRAQLTRIKSKNPAALFIVGASPDEIGNAIKQAKEVGLDAQLIGVTQSVSSLVLQVAGSAADGMIGVGNVFLPDQAGPTGQAFAKAYQDAYGKAPSVYAAISYDTIKILAAAINKAGSTDPDKVRDALKQISDFDGAMGSISMGDTQTVSYPLLKFQVTDGKVVPMS
jgi:branched-chain amino acid transport system substrate-binding protein